MYEFGEHTACFLCEEYDTPDMKTVNGILTGGGAKAAWFKDTEGNTMALVQDVRLNG